MTQTHIGFHDKVVIVTGGASGIGRATAIQFAQAGAKVVVADVNEDLAHGTVQRILEAMGEATFIRCDVSKLEDVENLVQKTVSLYGELNIACNIAGIQGPIFNTVNCPLSTWDKVLDVNLRGIWLSMKFEIPEMLKAGGGAIVNVSSVGGVVGFAGNPAYVASKHGVLGLTKTAALECAKMNIRVNAVCPGSIETPILENLNRTVPEVMEKVIAITPMQRAGSADEVASTILYLCSNQASFITGQALAVDGGWLAQ